jgi:hypothetical protein
MGRGRLAFAFGLRLSSHHFQMKDGVCIERNEYHVNTYLDLDLYLEALSLSFVVRFHSPLPASNLVSPWFSLRKRGSYQKVE